ncbi:hypothetical protein APY03_0564 [Variovorax sp. WDL1]|nr:hypothetical protein APY03_0564 [Variovorax sp. WDL1]
MECWRPGPSEIEAEIPAFHGLLLTQEQATFAFLDEELGLPQTAEVQRDLVAVNA